MTVGRERSAVRCLCWAAIFTGLSVAPSTVLAAGYKVEAEVVRQAGLSGLPGPLELVDVRLTYRDVLTGKPVSEGIAPRAWFRTKRANGLNCAQAVGSYLLRMSATREVLPLTGELVAIQAEGGIIAFVDRYADLATANVLATAKLPGLASQMIPVAGEIAALIPDAGAVVLVDVTGEVRTLGSGLVAPRMIVAEGQQIAIADGKGLRVMAVTGKTKGELAVADGVERVVLQSADPSRLQAVLFQSGGGNLVWADAALSPARQKVIARNAIGLTGAAGVALWLTRESRDLTLAYGPAFDRATRVALPFTPAQLLVRADGRQAFVVSADGLMAVVIDAESGEVLDRIDFGQPVSASLYSGRFIHAAQRDGTGIVMIDPSTIAVNGKSALRNYVIESARPGPVKLAVGNAEQGTVLAVPADGQSLRVYGNGNPVSALHTVPLRTGAAVLSHLSFERAFAAGDDQVFSVAGRLPATGPIELVTIGGRDNTVACLPIASTAPAAREDARLLVTAGRVDGDNILATLELENLADEAVLDWPVLEVQVRDLFGNSATVEAVRRARGRFDFRIRIRNPGEYHVIARLREPVAPGRLTVK